MTAASSFINTFFPFIFGLPSNSARLGGGALAGTLTRCTLTGNSAVDEGGGAWCCTLTNCTLTGNSARLGGGALGGTLTHCAVAVNSAQEGGGVAYGTHYNSIVYYNYGGNYDQDTTLNFSCTTPLPTNGVGNITGPALFMNLAAGDFSLWEGSPCIDAGMNLVGFSQTVTNQYGDVSLVAYYHDPTDILGNTRFFNIPFSLTLFR